MPPRVRRMGLRNAGQHMRNEIKRGTMVVTTRKLTWAVQSSPVGGSF